MIPAIPSAFWLECEGKQRWNEERERYRREAQERERDGARLTATPA
jgi:hypothetical protein